MRSRTKGAGILIGLAVLLSACAGGNVREVPVDTNGTTTRARPSGFEGNWVDERGAVSTFAGGVFSTVAGDTGEKLSEGSYAITAANTATINGVSLARQRRNLPADVVFNCLLNGPNQLNCTSSNGQQFVLKRRSA